MSLLNQSIWSFLNSKVLITLMFVKPVIIGEIDMPVSVLHK